MKTKLFLKIAGAALLSVCAIPDLAAQAIKPTPVAPVAPEAHPNLADKDVVRSNPPARVPLSNPQKIRFDQLPMSVQRRLLVLTHGSGLQDVTQGTVPGGTNYQATFEYNHRKIQLRLTSTGSLTWDDQNQAYAALRAGTPGSDSLAASGKAASGQTGTGSSESSGGLGNPKRITFAQLPIPVLSTIQSQAGAVPLETLEVGTKNGREVYQATYLRKGKRIRLQVGQDGNVLEAPQKEATPGAPPPP